MQTFTFPAKNKKIALALGAESAGNFSVYRPTPFHVLRGGLGRGCERDGKGSIYFSSDFGDLLEENNFIAFKKAVLAFLKKENITPDIIITDLHPMMKTTLWGEVLAKKFHAKHLQVQHHHAHIFSAVGDCMCPLSCNQERAGERFREISNTFYGIAMDGTGYGEDEKIWGGEVFQVKSSKLKVKSISRIGHLENQLMIGGEIAIREPARMLLAILSKFLDKKEVYNFIKKYYSKQKFEVLYNQLEQNFNCLETSSAGRVLDAVSLLLGFCGNERNYKHEPIDLLEKNSAKPYANLKPIIKFETDNYSLENSKLEIDSKFKIQNSKLILDTNHLFNYLVKNLHKDKHRLAATAQLYIAQGLWEIISKEKTELNSEISEFSSVFSAGGLANNKIISNYLISKGAYTNKKVPRGDAGLSFGQVVYYLLVK